MRFLSKCLILLLSISVVTAADNKAPFKPGTVSSFPNHQKISGVTIAADVYASKQELKSAFGKLNLSKYGLLPVLILIQNDSDQTLNLDSMRVEYIRPDGRRIEAIPAEEIRYMGGLKQPNISQRRRTSPIPGLGGGRKNPLAASEIEGRAFAARMLPPLTPPTVSSTFKPPTTAVPPSLLQASPRPLPARIFSTTRSRWSNAGFPSHSSTRINLEE